MRSTLRSAGGPFAADGEAVEGNGPGVGGVVCVGRVDATLAVAGAPPDARLGATVIPGAGDSFVREHAVVDVSSTTTPPTKVSVERGCRAG